MSTENKSDDILELLIRGAIETSERMTNLECRLCVTDVAVHILVNAYPDKEALKAHFTRAYVAMQGSDTARQNPSQAFAYEQLLERLFGLID